MLKENEAISVAAKVLHEIISLLHKNDPLFEAHERAYRKSTLTFTPLNRILFPRSSMPVTLDSSLI